MARSRTLQEGAFKDELSFESRDKIVQLDEVELTSFPLSGSLIQALWKRDVYLLEDDWYSEDNIRGNLDGWNELDIVWRNICDRNTLEAEDLAGILAVFIPYPWLVKIVPLDTWQVPHIIGTHGSLPPGYYINT